MKLRLAPLCGGIVLVLVGVVACYGQTGTKGHDGPANAKELELVEKLLLARRDYQRVLEQLRAFYLSAGDVERRGWAEEELRQYHRIPHQAFLLDLDVPPPTLQGTTNIVEANDMFRRALGYKDKGWGVDYIDNQRRAELLFQQLLTEYPSSNKISEAAYMLGDIYESKAYKQYRRAARYFERCFQWNLTTNRDARMRAARLYDKQLTDRTEAIKLYKDITTHSHDDKQIDEAKKRLAVLTGAK